MVDAKMRLVALAVLAGVGLSGCELDQKDPNYPDSITPTTFTALYNVEAGQTPWPNDAFFFGSTDGTLNIPAPYNAAPFTLIGTPLNTQDGWSISAPANTSLSQSIDGSTLAGSVRVVEVYLSNTTKFPASAAELPPGVASPVIRVLTPGTDYVAAVSTDIDSFGKILRINPLKPLRPSTGATNIGYMVFLTNGIRDTSGQSLEPSATYASYKAAPADCSNFTVALQKGLCGFAKSQLAIAAATGLNTANVVLSWSFSTQSVNDTLGALAQTVPATTIAVQATGLSTKALNPAAAGKANVYVGTTSIPYYLTKSATPSSTAVLTSFWSAAGPSPVPGIDPTSRNLSRFNPVPAKTADLTIPVFVTVPNATAAGGACVKPAAGWPVAIVQHGLGGNRLQAVAIADSFADACYVVAAIDMPLHGLTDTANPLYQAPNERTFNVDLVNNVTGAPPADGKIDPSGQHWINLSSSLTSRDNWRQGAADLVVFSKTVAKLDLNNDATSDVDPTRISYVGISLGGIMGGSFLAFAPNVRTATLSVPGGVITRLALDSPAFSTSIIAGLGAQGLVQNSTIFNNYFRDFQTMLDSGDPYSRILASQNTVPVHMQKVVGDTVVPNNSTDRLVVAGNLKKIGTLGPTPVGKGTGGIVTMTAGSHGSLFDPTSSPAATVEMQTQTVKFAASAVQPGGPFVVITNTAVVQP
jgi:pimeloyl-ACP methyl ester carboxylesterase